MTKKRIIVHLSVNIREQTILIIVIIAGIIGYNLWPQHVSQSYLQILIPITKKLYN